MRQSLRYSEEQLQAFKDENAAGVSYAGKHYTGYEATQKQRQIERTIRKQKNRILVAEQTGDENTLLAARIRLTRLRQEYKAFSKATGLPTQEERFWVSGFGRKNAEPPNLSNRLEPHWTETAKRVKIKPKNTPTPKAVNASATPTPKEDPIQHAKRVMEEQVKALPAEQQEALKEYTGFTATKINSAIRMGRITEQIQEKINILDAALRDGIMPKSIVLHRDTALSFLPLSLPKNPTIEQLQKTVGQVVENSIFTSTSFENLKLPGRNTELWIKVPDGYKGCQYIKPVALPKYTAQEEVLFARGMKYRITSAAIKDGKYVFEVEVLPQ